MADIATIKEQLNALTLMEAAQLVKELEEEWGVSAAAPVMMGGMVMAGGGGGDAAAAEEKIDFDVVLEDVGAQKIKVIKAVREIDPALGLKEAKDVVEATPATVLSGVPKETAEAAVKALAEAGAKAVVK